MKQFEPGSLVRLTWEDALHETAAQCNSVSEALNDYEPCIRKTVGHYIGEAEKNGRRCVVICTDDDREKGDEEKFGGPFFCPIGMVIRIEPLQVRVPPKRKKR